MKTCPNCGKRLNEDETVCSNCGLDLVKDAEETKEAELGNTTEIEVKEEYHPKRFVSKINYGPKLFEEEDNEFELLNEYIGKNIARMKNGFSWATFFFSVYYMFYRKMWLVGIFTIIFEVAIAMLIPNEMIVLLVEFVYSIIISALFKTLYIQKALTDIEKIKSDNPKLSNDELVPLVRKKGGTSGIVVVFLIVMGIAAFMTFGSVITETASRLGTSVFNLAKDRWEESKKSANQLNDLLRDGKEENVAGKLYIIFPKGYSLNTNTIYQKTYSNRQGCKIKVSIEDSSLYLGSIDAYINEKLKDVESANEENESLGLKYNNASYYGHSWKYTRDKKTDTLIYVTVYDNYVYDIRFEANNDTTCLLNAEVMATTFKFK
jgi:hypothetical protein